MELGRSAPSKSLGLLHVSKCVYVRMCECSASCVWLKHLINIRYGVRYEDACQLGRQHCTGLESYLSCEEGDSQSQCLTSFPEATVHNPAGRQVETFGSLF